MDFEIAPFPRTRIAAVTARLLAVRPVSAP
jgi:hypothetical protein